MRKAVVLLLLLVMGGSVAGLARSEGIASQMIVDSGNLEPYQRFFTEPGGALFTNLVAEEVTALRVTFSGPVPSLGALGFFATASIAKNEAGVATISGSIPYGGMVNLQWPTDGPQITKAEWLKGSSVVGALDVHTPVVRVAGRVDPVSTWPVTVVRINLDAFSSYDPDGRPLATYTWSWSDGMEQDGVAITRGLTNFNPSQAIVLDVTLTVTDAQGEKASKVVHFVIEAVEPA